MKQDKILALMAAIPWALERRTMEAFCDVLERRSMDIREIPQAALDLIETRSDGMPAYQVIDGVAFVGVNGVIAPRSSMVNDISKPKGSSVDALIEEITKAEEDIGVDSIALMIESPGGSVAGMGDLAQTIRDAKKKVVAYVRDLGASAAYWIASQADEIYISSTAAVGSIGVYTAIADTSARYEDAGIKIHLISSGEFKGIGVDGVKIDEKKLAGIKAEVDAYFSEFASAVAEGRSLSPAQVSAVATGQVFIGTDAVDLGLADGIKTQAEFVSYVTKQARDGLAQSVGGNPMGAEKMTQKEKNEDAEKSVQGARPMGSVAELKEAFPDLVDEIIEEARAEERAKVEALSDAFDAAVALDAYKFSSNLSEALIYGAKKAKEENEKALIAAQFSEDPVGDPGPESHGSKAETIQEKWDAMDAEAKSEFFNDFAVFEAAEEGR